MGIIPWSPLARGFLSGKYDKEEPNSTRYKSDPYLKSRYFRDNDFQVLFEVKRGAEENDISTAQMALAWILNNSAITSPIIGVTKLDHLEEAIEISEVKIDQHYFHSISAVYASRPIVGHMYNQPNRSIGMP